MKIRLLFSDMSFLPSGSDISDTCWRHSHLHESYTYYMVQTCRLPRETSSSVGGSNCKLLLPVTWHPAAVVIYVHRTVVFRPRGHLVHLWQFQLYDARREETLLKPKDVSPTMCQESFLPMKESRRLNQVRRNMGGLPADGFREVYPQKKRKRRSSTRNRPSFRFFLCAPPSAAGQGGREGLTWPPVKRACQNLLGFRGGTNPKEQEMLRLCFMQPCANWTRPVRNLDRQGPAGQQKGREGERVRDAVGIERVARLVLLTGCFINGIKHGQVLWLRIVLTSTAEGWKVGKKKGRQTGKGRAREECGNKDVWWVG